jgi:hypothetical protein
MNNKLGILRDVRRSSLNNIKYGLLLDYIDNTTPKEVGPFIKCL